MDPVLLTVLALASLGASSLVFVYAPRLDPIGWGFFAAWAVLSTWATVLFSQAWWHVALAVPFVNGAAFLLAALVALESEGRMSRVIGWLQDEDVKWRRKAAGFARRFPEHGLDILYLALKDADDVVRLEGARGLAKVRDSSSAIPALREALHDASAEVREAAAESLKKLGAEAVPDAWFQEIERLRDRKYGKRRAILTLKAPPLPGLGAKLRQGVVTGAAISVMTGSPTAGMVAVAMSALDVTESFRIPETCSLCDINQGTIKVVVENDFAVGVLGAVTGSTGLGKQKVLLSVPLCGLCARETQLRPMLEIAGYKEAGEEWQMELAFLNDKAADQFEVANRERVVSRAQRHYGGGGVMKLGHRPALGIREFRTPNAV